MDNNRWLCVQDRFLYEILIVFLSDLIKAASVIKKGRVVSRLEKL